MTTYYSQHSSLHLKGYWLKEAGFKTGRGVTVKISDGWLREQLYQAKQMVKRIRDVIV